MAVHVSSGACNLDMQFATVWLNKFNKYFITSKSHQVSQLGKNEDFGKFYEFYTGH